MIRSRLVACSVANVDGFVRPGNPLHFFVTLGEQDALAEGGYAGVPDPLRACLQRRSH
jgi:hypothetical protein